MDRILRASLSPAQRQRLSLAIDAVLRNSSVCSCLVLGGPNPSSLTIATGLHNVLLGLGADVQLILHNVNNVGTPRDVVHAQRGQSCIIWSNNASSFAQLDGELVEGDPVVWTFVFAGTAGFNEDENIIESIRTYVTD